MQVMENRVFEITQLLAETKQKRDEITCIEVYERSMDCECRLENK
ncbi:hypothetical protein [Bacillus sp. 166amftsu]|nr:hypothetical protein [Bacillus sp. 166amftsu]SDZ40400.1 hypothetical protein SAMN04488156_1283 [Bacillus sp. 166amftsu]